MMCVLDLFCCMPLRTGLWRGELRVSWQAVTEGCWDILLVEDETTVSRVRRWRRDAEWKHWMWCWGEKYCDGLVMSREGVREKYLVESWNWQVLEDSLGDDQKRAGGRLWRSIWDWSEPLRLMHWTEPYGRSKLAVKPHRYEEERR